MRPFLPAMRVEAVKGAHEDDTITDSPASCDACQQGRRTTDPSRARIAEALSGSDRLRACRDEARQSVGLITLMESDQQPQ